jgi:hypothetical protein
MGGQQASKPQRNTHQEYRAGKIWVMTRGRKSKPVSHGQRNFKLQTSNMQIVTVALLLSSLVLNIAASEA